MVLLNREKLILLMAAAGLNGAGLAARVGVTRATISQLVSGKRERLRPATAGKLAAALGADVLDFCSL